MTELIFIAFAFVTDFIVTSVIPNDPSMSHFIFMSSAAFSAMLCVTKEKNWYQSICIAFCVGVILDFLSYNTFMLYTPISVLCSLVLYQWRKHVGETILEQLMLLLSVLFVKESLVYFFMVIGHGFTLSFTTFLLNRCITTLMLNAPIVLIILYIYSLKQEFDFKLEENKKKAERRLLKDIIGK